MSFLHSFAVVLGVLCQNAFGAGPLYAPWFAAAAVCRVCEFVAVETSVDASRFNLVSGVAVLASEEQLRLSRYRMRTS